MKSKINQILTLCLLMVFQVALAQQTVSGTVTDQNGQPIPGATVVVDGTNNGTSTNFDGQYSIDASMGETLTF